MLRQHRLSILIAAMLLILDQYTKWLALNHVAPSWPVEITGFFNLVMVWNSGISFGMFDDGGNLGRWLLAAAALAISSLVAFWLWREKSRFLGFAYAIIFSGAIGNLIDRVRFGAVIDFLDFHLLGYHWPAFNVADSAIVTGALLIVGNLFVGQSDTNNDQRRTRGHQ